MLPGKRYVSMYLELASLHNRRKQFQIRDRFFVLAADMAHRVGRPEEAERLRLALLQLNRYHLLKAFASFGEALQSADVHSHLNDLRESYPPQTANQMLESLRKSVRKK